MADARKGGSKPRWACSATLRKSEMTASRAVSARLMKDNVVSVSGSQVRSRAAARLASVWLIGWKRKRRRRAASEILWCGQVPSAMRRWMKDSA